MGGGVVAGGTATLAVLQAFMSGKIKLKGNMALAMKLQQVIDAAKK